MAKHRVPYSVVHEGWDTNFPRLYIADGKGESVLEFDIGHHKVLRPTLDHIVRALNAEAENARPREQLAEALAEARELIKHLWEWAYEYQQENAYLWEHLHYKSEREALQKDVAYGRAWLAAYAEAPAGGDDER